MWPFEKKENPVGAAFMVPQGQTWKRAGRQAYIHEGYQLNVVIYRAIREIIHAASSIGVEVHRGDEVIDGHPALALLENPNPGQSWEQLLSETISDRLLFGEQCIIGAGGPQFAELWVTRPTDMEIIPGRYGLPSGYKFDRANYKKLFPADEQTGASDVFFTKLHNPADPWRGQSPLMAASLAADTHNAGMRWNYSLLQNSARPSGIIRFKGSPTGEVVNRLTEYFKKRFAGAANAGEIPMLTDDAEWQAMDLSPRDMDYHGTMQEMSKLIASALGVPLPLVDNDASTFNNLEQAKERLYTDTVIPLMNDFLGALGRWLLPRYGEGLQFCLDLDSIPALEAIRQRTFDRAMKAVEAQVLTREEARALIGYDPAAEGEFIQRQPQQIEQRALLAKLAYG